MKALALAATLAPPDYATGGFHLPGNHTQN
jgi:hypothetical protein